MFSVCTKALCQPMLLKLVSIIIFNQIYKCHLFEQTSVDEENKPENRYMERHDLFCNALL